MPVRISANKARPIRAGQPSSRRANQARVRGFSCRATIATMAAKLSWKLAPARLSGQSKSTTNAPTATMRKVSASRPKAMPARTSRDGDAGAHGRHFGAGQQGVGDAGQRARARGDQDEAVAQRQRRAQRQQFQRQQHHRADHGGEVQPADREQMGEARTAHRVVVRIGNAILVAGGERGGDAAFAGRRQLGADMGGEALAQAGEAAGEAPAPKPARSIRCRARGRCRRSAGTRRRGRNHRRRAPASAPAASPRRAPATSRAGLEPRHHLVGLDIDPQPHRQARRLAGGRRAGSRPRRPSSGRSRSSRRCPSAARARSAARRRARPATRSGAQPRAAARLNMASARPQRVPAPSASAASATAPAASRKAAHCGGRADRTRRRCRASGRPGARAAVARARPRRWFRGGRRGWSRDPRHPGLDPGSMNTDRGEFAASVFMGPLSSG